MKHLSDSLSLSLSLSLRRGIFAVAVMLTFLLGSQRVQAQAGAFDIPLISNPVNDPATAITRCTINWTQLTLSSVKGININIAVDGAYVCINGLTGPDPTIVNPGFAGSQYTKIFTTTSINIYRTAGTPFSPPAGPYTPFVVLAFRAAPKSSVTIRISGSVSNAVGTLLPIQPASTTWTVAEGGEIAGDIFKPAGVPCTSMSNLFIPGVTVVKEVSASPAPLCFPGVTYEQTLFPAGLYNFAASPFFFPYRITPIKTATDVCCGVGSADIKAIQDYILGLGTFDLGQAVAADFNQDNSVTALDLLNMTRCVTVPMPPLDPIFYSSAYTPWRFVPFASPWWPTNPPVPLATVPASWNITLTPANSGSSPFLAPFWGVKRGDVNGDCNVCGSSLTGSGAGDRTAVILQDVQVTDRRLYAEEEVLLPIVTASIRQASFFGLELFFDPTQVDVLEVVDDNMPHEFTLHSIVPDQNGMAVRYAWLSMERNGVDVSDRQPLFYVRLRAKRDLPSLEKVIWQMADSNHNWLYSRACPNKMAFKLNVWQATPSAFSLALSGANPVSTEIQVDLNLPNVSALTLSLLDPNGVVVKRISRTISAGPSSLLLTDLPAMSGLYTVIAQTSFGQQALRFVKI